MATQKRRPNRNEEVYTSIRKPRDGRRSFEVNKASITGIGAVVTSVLAAGGAVYVRKSKDDSVIVRVFLDDERYEEVLRPDEDLYESAEELIEALWDLDTVGVVRRALAAPAERAAKARGGASEG